MPIRSAPSGKRGEKFSMRLTSSWTPREKSWTQRTALDRSGESSLQTHWATSSFSKKERNKPRTTDLHLWPWGVAPCGVMDRDSNEGSPEHSFRTHVRGVLSLDLEALDRWYGVNDKKPMGRGGCFTKVGERKRLGRFKGMLHISWIASRWPKVGISRTSRGDSASQR